MKVPLGGGTTTALASGLNFPQEMAIDQSNVYWGNQQAGTLTKVPLAGGATTTLASGIANIEGIAVDSTSVYWADANSGVIVRLTPK